MKFEIVVELKPEVLDPEGKTICKSIQDLGHSEVSAIEVAKRYLVTLEDHLASPEELVSQIAEEYLSNPVAERFKIQRIQ